MQEKRSTAALERVPTEGIELLALHKIAELIDSAPQRDTTLSRILEVLNDTMKMKRATLVLYEKPSDKLVIKASCGLTQEEIARGVYRPDEGICGHIFQTRSPFVVPDVQIEPLFLNRTGARTNVTRKTFSFIGVPVMVQGQPQGVLTVDRLFGDEVSYEKDIRFLTVLATLITQFIILHREIEIKEVKPHTKHGKHFIVGHSKPMQEVVSIIYKIAPSKATVFLLGESGTGKELVAQAIHENGPRKNQPFIKINCAALEETLLESELFGHERSAFPNAQATRPGRFELADEGTIFLDEIGEMPLSVQAKILRILQEKQFERLGGTKTFTVDVRIVAATTVSLETAVAKGNFRADLYYRLNVVPIILPPLRERTEDIPLLFNHFLNMSNARNQKQIKLTSELLDFLSTYAWPGNVREMQNLVERMVILAENDRLTLNDWPATITSQPADTHHIPEHSHSKPSNFCFKKQPKELQEIERQEVEAALRRNGWIQIRAAKELGLSQRQIGYRIKKYGLSRYDSFRN